MTSRDPRESHTSDPLFGKGSLVVLFAWGLAVLAFSVGGLADVTSLWWLVLLFGVAAPVALVAVRDWASRRAAVGGAAVGGERDLLHALREHGELTPTAAAMLTPFTTAEAAKMLERLAREGHLEARIRDGAIAYALRESDRLTLSGPPQKAADEDALPGATSAEPLENSLGKPLEEPLSERELAVLRLLATGHTNREIAQELFIARGTVKAHVASVYRKLGVHSRAEAASRAGDLDLLE